MTPLLWYSLAMLAGTPPSDGFSFHDVSEVEGRSVLVFRPLELAEPRIKLPVPGLPRVSGAGRLSFLPVGSHPDTYPRTGVQVAWDPEAAGGAALWLDADGDGRLDPNERHAFTGKELSVPFTMTVRRGEVEEKVQRTVIFRRSSLGPGLSYAVRGCLRGKIAFGAVVFDAVLIDANGDGCFHGAGIDRVWIDFNRNGKFDPLTEQFTLGRPLTVEGVPYIIAADPLGKTVRARKRGTETGKLRLDLPARLKSQVRHFHADLLNDLGEMISVTTEGKAFEVPSSRYRLMGVTLELADGKNRRWHYSFHRYGETVFDLPPQGEKLIALAVVSQMTLSHDGKADGVRPGTELTARPFLADPCGLFLTNCFVEEGALQNPCTAEVRLLGRDGKVLDTFTSGFN
jgi:hypothetical protein